MISNEVVWCFVRGVESNMHPTPLKTLICLQLQANGSYWHKHSIIFSLIHDGCPEWLLGRAIQRWAPGKPSCPTFITIRPKHLNIWHIEKMKVIIIRNLKRFFERKFCKYPLEFKQKNIIWGIKCIEKTSLHNKIVSHKIKRHKKYLTSITWKVLGTQLHFH
jgi:hypothetical protein